MLPARLENLLIARIDALPPDARSLAQIAAVIGRTFEEPLLERVADGDIGADLLELVRADIVREMRRYPDLVCEFRHGLLHEAALSTLTQTRHRELAGRVGSALEDSSAKVLWMHRSGSRSTTFAATGSTRRSPFSNRPRTPGALGHEHGVELLEAARRAAARDGDTEAEARIEARLAERPAARAGRPNEREG